ncbi:hypothetical protein FB45DRAFT_1095770 [Roridomyces roridus]|uniref:DUF6533 domain-containing protein n=1 Tax=Roridomyces roridus TaxID=1738132 RepID=A0AAD7FEL3_9AGAR|nr:hypothetical protein FB45DRAFT_1095770 [Roridomyces roridus]
MDNSDLYDFQIVAYVDVAFLCLLVYDTLLQVSQEHLHIWKSRWSVIKCLYLWTRYAAYVDSSMAIVHRVDITTLPSSSCNSIGTFDTVFAGLGIGITEVILMIRTYALYGRSKKLVAFFVIMWLSLGGLSLWSVLRYTNSTAVDSGNSCDTNNSSSKMWIVCYVALLVGETIIVVAHANALDTEHAVVEIDIVSLTLWGALFTNGLSFFQYPSKRVTTFYRDGLFFYLAFLSVFIIDVVLKVTIARPALQNVADTPLRVLHSILACRLVIHLRQVAAEEESCPSTGQAKSPIMFAEIKGDSQSIV